MPKAIQGVPFDLPEIPVEIDYSLLVSHLSKAHASLARLDETLNHLRNPSLIERTFLTREAVLSSQIEGTQATLEEVLKKEAVEGEKVAQESEKGRDIKEIMNYRKAMRRGVKFIDDSTPLSENTVKELHNVLLQSVRGKTKNPGEFRRKQVWIAPPGTPMEEARYVPPTPIKVPALYGNFDRYLNNPSSEQDALVQIAIAHYQFEALHPFEDGNGRVGRLLIPLFLYERKILSKPFVYLSKYLEEHRTDYYNLLADVSYKGEWIPWIRFFLNGLYEQANDANSLSKEILAMQIEYQDHLSDFHSPYAFELLKAIFEYPVITAAMVPQVVGIKNPQTVLNLIRKFVEKGILIDLSPERKRNKLYKFSKLLDLLEEYKRAEVVEE